MKKSPPQRPSARSTATQVVHVHAANAARSSHMQYKRLRVQQMLDAHDSPRAEGRLASRRPNTRARRPMKRKNSHTVALGQMPPGKKSIIMI